MPRELELLPVLHAQGGKLVAPSGEPVDEPLHEVARRFKRQFGALYVVDLDGIQRNRPDVALLQELAKAAPVWADAGSRFHTDVMDLMVTGAEQVTVRYETLRDEPSLEETLRMTEQVALGLEFQGGELVPNARWPATPPELVSLAESYDLPMVLIDLDRAGRAQGIERSVAWHARHHGPGAYYAGGVAGRRDLDVLEGLGYRGALVSTALLEGAELEGAEWPGPAGLESPGEDTKDDGVEGYL